MYKTVRHGENSLQYTILPQNDDFRGGATDGGRKRSSRTCRHNRKKSIVAYVGLFFVCAVIAGTLLIPLMVTSDLMPSPASWFYRAQKAREMRNPVSVKYQVDKTAPTAESAPAKAHKTQSPAWSDMLNITEFEKLYDESNALAAKSTPHAPQTVTTESTSTSTEKSTTVAPTSRPSAPAPTHINTRKQPLVASIRDSTRFSSKPIVVVSQQNDKIAVKSASGKIFDEKNWVQSHWPYVDPSTYFQWVGNTEDRVILPVILGIAFLLVLLIVVLCVIARRKGVCKACAKRNGRNTFEKLESQNDDNKTLLTSENHSEEE
ncbi:uncharacterized protein LOC132258967 [Phlebotomus argentipes]|uniref:uncharacterized protein LOC132258967 n=1 Tax=Phlebotomus argentipes TaxID=94469 RepID=UPI002892DCD7|nr:uncharacterized protein LOC132258967 [Phlebotomus argentipes]XP_059612522.1 uncharacterized protein LOC132258967 [Phlebotomus argentipes]